MAKEIECFGVGDLLFKRDGTIAMGSAILNSASGEFKDTDVDKTIVVNGAGVSGKPLITTIASWTSATQVTLGATASTAVSSPAIYYYGTDDTAAFQRSIDLTVAAGGGVILLGQKNYLITNSLKIPGRDFSQMQVALVEFRGAIGPMARNWNNSFAPGGDHDAHLSVVGQTIVQWAGSDIGTMILVDPAWPTPPSLNPTGVQVLFENIVFRVLASSAVTALDLRRVYSCRIIDVTIEPSDHQSNLPEPVGGSAGIWLPETNNGAQVFLRRIGIAGFWVGMRQFEHADLGDIWFYRCTYALVAQPSNHAPLWGRIQITWCPYGIVTSNTSPGPPEYISDGGFVNFEDSIDGHWAATVNHVIDPSNNLRGSFTYKRTKAFVGSVSGLIVNGGKNLIIKEHGKPLPARVTSLASSSTPTPNADTDDVYILTALAANATFGVPSGTTPMSAQELLIRILDNGSARTITWNTIYRSIAPLPSTTVANKTTYVTLRLTVMPSNGTASRSLPNPSFRK